MIQSHSTFITVMFTMRKNIVPIKLRAMSYLLDFKEKRIRARNV
jgi:hypothetical protein